MSMFKVGKALFVCPICYVENPEGKIFQCRNGHSVCAECSFKLERCSECRVPLGQDRIPNRALEALISELEIPCTHKAHGCTAEMARKELSAHLSTCPFRPTGICKSLGYECGFVSLSAKELCQHVVAQHKNGRMESGTVHKREFDFDLDTMRTTRGKYIHSKVIELSSTCRVMEIHNINTEKGEFSLFCIHFGDEEDDCNYDVKIKLKASTKKLRLSWAGTPVHYKKLEESLKNPSIKIPIPFVLEQFDEPKTRLYWEYVRQTTHSDSESDSD